MQSQFNQVTKKENYIEKSLGEIYQILRYNISSSGTYWDFNFFFYAYLYLQCFIL